MSIIYGDDIKDLTIKLGDTVSDFDTFDGLNDGVINFASSLIIDEVTVDLNNNARHTVYGDMRNLTFDFNALNHDTVGSFDSISGFKFVYGDDVIDLSPTNGNNLLYGDMQDLSMSIKGGFATNGAEVGPSIDSNEFSMGDDIISSAMEKTSKP